jgi:hypothetical protein
MLTHIINRKRVSNQKGGEEKELDWDALIKILQDKSKVYIEVKSLTANGVIQKNTVYTASLELSNNLITTILYYKSDSDSDFTKFENVFTDEGNLVDKDSVDFNSLYQVIKIVEEPSEDIKYAEKIDPSLSPLENSLNNIITGQKNLDGNIGKGLMGAFTSIYQLYGVIAMVLILAIFALTTVDMIKVLILELVQKITIALSPNMFNKDTLDFSNLLYAKNNKDLEPYSIYLKQTIISNMFQLTTLFVLTLLIQVGLYMILNTLNALKKITYTEKLTPLSADMKPFQVIGLMLVIAFILNLYYNSRFLKNLQPVIITSSDNIQRITDSIYNNMTSNEEFLNSVLDENINESIRIINKQGTRYETIGSMIFTISLYNYFKINISTTDPIFKNIREIFTLKERRLRNIVPANYMYYKQNIFIPNLHTVIEPHISADINVLNTGDKRNTVRRNVASRIKHVNLALTSLFTLTSAKRKLRLYILREWVILSICMVGIYVIYRKEFNNLYWNTIYPILNTINQNTTEVFKKRVYKVLEILTYII